MTGRAASAGVVAVLDRECGVPRFSAAAEVEPDLLDLQVAGVGPVRFPVTPTQARKLRALAIAAPYGRGTQTLTDASVRDTWQIPREAVTVRWGDGFAAVLDALREELGLPPSCVLRAEPHSMLVYERGQFFLTHQDSETHDSMVATLVVTLPSRYTGGELVIERGGAIVRHRGSASKLALAAFYADCRHEVRPVKTGNRITLTFNLLLDSTSASPPAGDAAAVDELARHLRRHFTTPRYSTALRYSKVPAVPPDRLVYLLDHEYTERGLNWARLKGGDASRAALLRVAAEHAGCRIMLALCDIRETWDAISADEDDGWYNYSPDDEQDGDGDEQDGDYELADLIESSTRLVRWTDPDTGRGEKITLDIGEDEVCAGTANSSLSPYEQQYEGYMGNYGNTLDRWYRRAALVLFPADREFANRAEASPAWAMDQIAARARAGDLAGARAYAADLAPFWAASVRQSLQPDSLEKSLSTAVALDDAATATLLLEPFRVEHLRAVAGAPLPRLARHYGGQWTCELLRGWFGMNGSHVFDSAFGFGDERLDWYSALPDLCQALQDADAEAARTLVELSWQRVWTESDRLSVGATPSQRVTGLTGLGPPLAHVLAAADRCRTGNPGEQIARQLGEFGEERTAWMLAALRAATELPGHQRLGGIFEAIAADCARHLRKRLARPARAASDWSITTTFDCNCALCDVLSNFLEDPARRVFEWPLAAERRRHVHSYIDRRELPVSHRTRRQGRPYTLVLAKQNKLFDDERTARARDKTDLEWLTTTWPATARQR